MKVRRPSDAGDQEGSGRLRRAAASRSPTGAEQDSAISIAVTLGQLGELRLDRRDPVDLLVGIEEEFEADHGQEGAAEAGDADMGARR